MLGGLFGGPDVERPEQTEQERRLSRRGADEWNRYVRDYVPVTTDLAEHARTTDADRRDLRADAIGAAAQQTPRARTLAQQTGPQTGALAQTVGEATTQRATGAGRQIARGQQELDAREHQGLLQAIGAGQGIADTGSSLRQARGRAETQRNIQDMQHDIQDQQERQQMVQTGLMAGAGVAGEAGWLPEGGLLSGSESGELVQPITSTQRTLSRADDVFASSSPPSRRG